MAPGVFHFSRSDSLDYSFFRISKWILGLLDCWPLDPLHRINKVKVVFNLTILLTAALGELRSSWLLRKNLLEALDVLSPGITKLVTFIKLVCFLIYRKDLELILRRLLEHCKTDTKNCRKNLLIAKASYFVNMCCTVLYVNAITTSFSFGVKPLIVWVYQYFINGKRSIWVALPYRAALPYEDMTKINNKPLYTILYCILAHSGFITTFAISGTDGAFLCFCMYISVGYQCLQEDFKSTFKVHTTDNDPAKNKILYTELSGLIRRQQRIIEIFESFNRIYTFMIFIHFLSASILLALLLINVLLASGVFKTMYLLYALGIMNHLFACCFGAESVNENCLKLSEVLYFSDWYRCDRKVKMLILFALVKSQKGSPMKAPFFSPSLQLFASIIQTTVSYFTILQTVL